MTEPCTWPVDRSCLPIAETDIDKQKQADAENMAVSVLWALSGRQYGVCPVIARPCPQVCAPHDFSASGPGWYPLWSNGQWRNVSCGCAGSCSYASPSVVHLAGPVAAVTEVNFGDQTVDPTLYRLEGNRLYRTDGSAWPTQNLAQPLPNPGTWSVEYSRGTPPPANVAVLVGLLALEFLSACSGGKCRLPRRVTSVSRQGVSYQMIDPTDIYATGKTGLPEVDLWLSAVNPAHLSEAPRVR